MRSFITPMSARLCPGIIIAAALLASGSLRAGNGITSQGAGAARLEGGYSAAFIRNASQANSAEIAFAELAMHKTQNAHVMDFARTMKIDHQIANERLRPIAQSQGVAMNVALDETHKEMYDHYQQLSGTEFDQQYMKDMLKGHQQVIAMFEKAARQSHSLEVKQYAQSTLPTLNQHFGHAHQTALAVGIDQQTIASILNEPSSGMGGTSDESQKESGSDNKP